MPNHWVEVHHVEWDSPGARDGERCVRVMVSDGRRRVKAVLDANGARGIARDLYAAARWAEVGLVSPATLRRIKAAPHNRK